MRRLAQLSLLSAGLVTLAAASDAYAQEKGGKKEPAHEKQDKETPEKGEKFDPSGKGQLPTYWKQLGLSDEQKAKVYRLNAKYAADIDKLEAQIKEMKAKLAKERNEILDPAQKKKLEEIYKKKSGADK